MVIEYNPTLSFNLEKPQEVEITTDKVYLRRNIVENQDYVKTTNPVEMVHKWSYEECILYTNDYKEYLSDAERLSTLMTMQSLEEVKLDHEIQSIKTELSTNEMLQSQAEMEINILTALYS